MKPTKEPLSAREARIQELRTRMTEVRARLPKHTPPPALLIELDELEGELLRLQAAQT